MNYIEENIKRDNLGRFIKGTSNPWNRGMKGYTNSGSFTTKNTSGKNNPFYGRRHSEESKKKISLNSAMRNDPKIREKLSRALRGRKLPVEMRLKLSEINKKRVENGTHNFWKGGISRYYTEINHALRNQQWRHWREAVFERDNYTCQVCGTRSGNGKKVVLHPHHIIPVVDCIRKNKIDLIYDIANGKTVCFKCHKLIHSKGTMAHRSAK